MNSRIYLDKIATGPHVPNHELFKAHNFTHVLPDMNHTGIVTKYGQFKPRTCAPDGRIPKLTRDMAFKKTRPIERERIHQEAQEKVFVLNHTQFMNNVLSDLEKTKREKDKRRDELLGSSIRDHNSLTSSGGRLSEFEPTTEIPLKSMSVKSEVWGPKDSSQSISSRLTSTKKRACNREELVTCLLDSVDPPRSTREWFGTIPREFDGSQPASPELSVSVVAPRSPPSRGITTAAQEKWEAESIFKAIHGCEAANALNMSSRPQTTLSQNQRSPSRSPTRSPSQSLKSPPSNKLNVGTKGFSSKV
jgi:hypothetical protein